MPDYQIKGDKIIQLDGCESFVARGGGFCLFVIAVLVIGFVLLVYDGLTYGAWTANIWDAQATATVANGGQVQLYSKEAGNALLGNGAIRVVQPDGNVSAHLGSTGTLTFDDIGVGGTVKYTLTINYDVRDKFSVQLKINQASTTQLSFDPGSNSQMLIVELQAGANSIEFFDAHGDGNACNTNSTGGYCDTIDSIAVQ